MLVTDSECKVYCDFPGFLILINTFSGNNHNVCIAYDLYGLSSFFQSSWAGFHWKADYFGKGKVNIFLMRPSFKAETQDLKMTWKLQATSTCYHSTKPVRDPTKHRTRGWSYRNKLGQLKHTVALQSPMERMLASYFTTRVTLRKLLRAASFFSLKIT